MASPIERILEHVPSSLVNIAPERKELTLSLLQDVDLKRIDSAAFDFHAQTTGDQKYIAIPEQGVELLWTISFMLWERYRAHLTVSEGGTPDGRTEADGLRLVAWALRNQELGAHRVSWPEHLPSPTGFEVSSGEPRYERIADEITLCAVGWLLHHELTHIRNADSPKVSAEVSRKQEREADRGATLWLLDLSPPGVALHKRALGIVAALVTIAAYELDWVDAEPAERRHPTIGQRLFDSLNHPNLPSDSVVFLIAAMGLRVFIKAAGLTMPTFDGEPEDAQAYFAAHCAAMQAGRRTEP